MAPTDWQLLLTLGFLTALGLAGLYFLARMAFFAWARRVYSQLVRDIGVLERRLRELKRLDAITQKPLGFAHP